MTDMRVVVADDHQIVRDGLVALLGGSTPRGRRLGGRRSLGPARRGGDRAGRRGDGHPDAPPRRHRGHPPHHRPAPGVRVVMLTINEDDETILPPCARARRAICSRAPAPTRCTTPSAPRPRAGWCSARRSRPGRGLLRHGLGGPRRHPAEPFPDLSERERTVLHRLAAGRSNDDIAARALRLQQDRPHTLTRHLRRSCTLRGAPRRSSRRGRPATGRTDPLASGRTSYECEPSMATIRMTLPAVHRRAAGAGAGRPLAADPGRVRSIPYGGPLMRHVRSLAADQGGVVSRRQLYAMGVHALDGDGPTSGLVAGDESATSPSRCTPGPLTRERSLVGGGLPGRAAGHARRGLRARGCRSGAVREHPRACLGAARRQGATGNRRYDIRQTRRWSADDVVAVRGATHPPRASPPIRGALWAATDRQATLSGRPRRAAGTRTTPEAIGRRARFASGVTSAVRCCALVVNDLLDGARSLGELDVARELRRRGLPRTQTGRLLPQGHERTATTSTSYWDDCGLVVEIDGIHHAWAAERRRATPCARTPWSLSGRRRASPAPPWAPARSPTTSSTRSRRR